MVLHGASTTETIEVLDDRPHRDGSLAMTVLPRPLLPALPPPPSVADWVPSASAPRAETLLALAMAATPVVTSLWPRAAQRPVLTLLRFSASRSLIRSSIH